MKLQDFLVKAKINTYASSGEGGEKILDDGSKELVFEEDDFKYRDRYFGFNSFIGEEIVWQSKKVIWGMNYYGEILSNDVDTRKIYNFLKEALKLVSPEIPFRGPLKFEEGEWKYENKSKGNVALFEGEEVIYFKREKVYELKYHGGLVNKS